MNSEFWDFSNEGFGEDFNPQNPEAVESHKDRDLINYLNRLNKMLEENGKERDPERDKLVDDLMKGKGDAGFEATDIVCADCEMFLCHPDWAEGKEDRIQALIGACDNLIKNHEEDLKFGYGNTLKRFLERFKKK